MWSNSENNYYHGASRPIDRLPPAIYRLSHAVNHGLFLVRVQDKFPLPQKLYGLDIKLIDHVVMSMERTKKNIGVLLAGLKGAGKTITAKQLCNRLELPVILITTAYHGIADFLNDIKEDLVIFVDEYEKVFKKEHKDDLLTVMDGALDNGSRRVFLLTSNDLYPNPNLSERTGRIRYLRQYRDLEATVITEIIDDTLKFPKLRSEIIQFVSSLETITIDIILAIIDEVNMCGKSPEEFKEIFNVKVNTDYCDIYEMTDDKLERLFVDQKIINYNNNYIGQSFMRLGTIKKVIDPLTFIIVDHETKKQRKIIQKRVTRLHCSFRPTQDDEYRDDMIMNPSGWEDDDEYSE